MQLDPEVDATDIHGLTEEQLAVLNKLPERVQRAFWWSMSRWPGRLALRIAASLQRIQIFDRSMTIAAQLFTSVFPIIIMGASLLGADFTHSASEDLAVPEEAQNIIDSVVETSGIGAFGIIGVIIVLISATSLSRAMTRAYDAIWQHGRTRTRVTEAWRWLAAVMALTLSVVCTSALVRLVDSIPPADLWTNLVRFSVHALSAAFVPWLLMAGRVPIRQLAVGAVLFAGVMVMSQPVASRYLPIALASSASRYGSIGVAFTILTYLYVVSFALLGFAVIGQVIARDDSVVGRFIRGEHRAA
jgi:membrane protein